MKKSASLFPSLISSDLLNLATTIKSLDPYCAGYHLDIMDNHFVPNLTWGTQFVNAIARATSKQVWVHLMIDNPASLIRRLELAPDNTLSFHIETKENKNNLIALVKEKKWRASIAISPKTATAEVFPYLGIIDQVLIMSVEPGFSGQQFLPSAINKLQALAAYRAEHNLSFRIGIDGGITAENIAMLAQEGADDIAIANAIFGNGDPIDNLEALKNQIRET